MKQNNHNVTHLFQNIEASFSPVIHNERILGIDQQNIYARELASPVLHIAKDFEGQLVIHKKKANQKKKTKKKKISNTKRNNYSKQIRSKSVNNNRRKLEKRINFYRIQNI